MLSAVTEEELSDLYAWVDSVPLSRPKKSIARDFSDAVCVAEIVHHYFPRIVELHNYSPASNSTQKMYNWTTLNTRVFKKLGFTLSKEDMEGAVYARTGEIEPILKLLRSKLALYQAKHGHERASQIPLLATSTPGGSFPSPEERGILNGAIFSRGAPVEEFAKMAATSTGRGKGTGIDTDRSGVNKMLDYNGVGSEYVYNENGGGNLQEINGGKQGGGNKNLIQSFPGGAATAIATSELMAEVEDLRALNQVLEVKTAKLEQLLRLKDAKIAALTARLHGAGLLSSPPPPPHAFRSVAAETGN